MNARQKIAVTGATGRVGSHLVELLEGSGHEVVPISRSNGVDIITGEGLKEALASVNTVVDTATGPSPDREAATQFF
ncbi:MAG: NAD-dependent epimerase/dehydratase family protein, partial [Thermoleophilia bacterium]